MPAYVVFSDATLLAIAERRPTDNAALLAIPGIGRAKLDSFGQDVIEDRHRHALTARAARRGTMRRAPAVSQNFFGVFA